MIGPNSEKRQISKPGHCIIEDRMLDMRNASQPKKVVFLVDDELDIISVMKVVLERSGFLVHAFDDPNQALEAFKADGKDCAVVLSDIRMPRMSGFQLARQVSQLRPDVRIVLMTAFEINKTEFDKVLPSTDVAAFIRKPVGGKKLLDTLGALFVDGR